MAILVLLGSTDVHAAGYLVDDDGSFDVSKVLNRRHTASCVVEDYAGTYRPAVLSELVVWDDTRVVTDGQMTSGSALLISATAAFVAGDVGRSVEVLGAGPAGATLVSTIATRINSTTVTLAVTASTSVGSATARIGYREFGGVVVSVEETDAGEAGAIRHRVDAEDYGAYLDRVYVTLSTAEGQTLKQVVEAVLAAGDVATAFGLVLDSGMASGATMPALAFDDVTVSEAFADLQARTTWLYTVTPEKLIRWRTPTADAMPAAITDATPLTRLRARQDARTYQNRARVLCGPAGSFEVTDDLSALADGSNRVFPLSYRVAAVPGVVAINGVWLPVAPYVASDSLFEWMYRDSDNALVQAVTFSAPPVSSTPVPGGQTVHVPLLAQSPFLVTAEDAAEIAARRVWERQVAAPAVTNLAAGQQLADALVARDASLPRTVTWDFWTPRYGPGQVGTITRAARNLAGESFLITEVVISIDRGMRLQYAVSAIEGSQARGSWREWFDALARAGAATGTISGGALVGGGGGGTTTVVTTGITSVELGGSRLYGYVSSAWRDAPDYSDKILISSLVGSGARFRCHQKTSDAGTAVQVRVIAIDGDGNWLETCAEGSAATNTSWGYGEAGHYVDVPFTPRTGTFAYRLEIKGSNANADVWVAGAHLLW